MGKRLILFGLIVASSLLLVGCGAASPADLDSVALAAEKPTAQHLRMFVESAIAVAEFGGHHTMALR